MNIAIIMGRGIEGCGVTKFTVEQTKWLFKNGHDYTVYASKDKSWSRKKSHILQNTIQLKFAKKEEVDKMITGCNNADVVIINSLPSVGHPTDAIIQFKRFLSEVKKPIVVIQHDHSIQSIRRNAAIEETVYRADVIFGHSSRSDFAKYVSNLTGTGISPLFCEDTSKPVHNFQPGMDFDEVRKTYWLDIDQTNPLHHKWIGRTTSWKGYVQLFKLHNEFLRNGGYITTLEGIERSQGYPEFAKLSEMNAMIGQDINTIELEQNQPAYVFGPYNNHEMLQRMAKCGFGYQLTLLDARFIERSIEYTHCEVASIGVVPVFRKLYGERCTHRATGDKLIQCKNTGTIWLDDEEMEPAYELIKKLTQDKVMRNEYREMAFEFYKSHQDASHTFSEMMKKILKNIS